MIKVSALLLLFVLSLALTQELRRQANVDYPVRFTYVNRLSAYYGAQKIAAAIGVPGYAAPNKYNYVALAFWTCNQGATDAVTMWTNPLINFGESNPFGKTNDQIRKTWRRLFNEKGIKILVSAFGATQNPTSGGHDPVSCATKLGNFVLGNNLDGVDLDWEDNEAMNRGLGEAWLIAFTRKLRQMIPDHVLTHAPQAPYFCKENYKNGAYITIHEQVGDLIDFYNVQFYNQVDTTYDTYERLFVKSVGFFNKTSVKEINERGIPLEMLVVGKPATPVDASNTGYMNQTALGHAVTRAVKESTWKAGVMFWQFFSDSNGTILDAVIKGFKSTEEEVI